MLRRVFLRMLGLGAASLTAGTAIAKFPPPDELSDSLAKPLPKNFPIPIEDEKIHVLATQDGKFFWMPVQEL